MVTTEEVRERVEHLNSRDFDFGTERMAEDIRFHAPGLGKDVQGRDAVLEVSRSWIESADVHYELLGDVVELGPFTMILLRHLATIDGERTTYDVLLVDRWEGDKVVETWSLRASEPSPVAGSGG
jgi:hypothetical protein